MDKETGMPSEYGFTFTKEKCIQCHGCEVACKSWRDVELGIYYRRVENIWKGQYPETSSFSLSISCLHCVTPACEAICPVKAISKDKEKGIVLVDRETCIGCRECLEACPFDIPQFGEDEKMQKCDMCFQGENADIPFPPCVETCPTEALQLVKINRMEKLENEKLISEMIC